MIDVNSIPIYSLQEEANRPHYYGSSDQLAIAALRGINPETSDEAICKPLILRDQIAALRSQ